MTKVTDGSYATVAPVAADEIVGVQKSGPAVKIFTLAGVRDLTNMVQASLADADTTMAVNTMYVGSMSAWATADRTYKLPTTAAVGDRIGIMITAGNTSTFELIITAETSDTLNAIAGGTEWSRLFITGECVIMRCVTADSAWIVEYDGRIPCSGGYYISTGSAATGGAGTIYLLTAFPSATGTAFTGVGFVASGGQVTTRRAGVYDVVSSYAATSISDAKYASAFVYVNGAVAARNQMAAGAGAAGYRFVGWQGTIAAGQTVDGRVRAEDANSGIVATESYWFAAEVL